jgi:glycosyltransferase involved in cell wall biosynthesis
VGEFKSRFGINEENMVLYIGRINKRKGIDILIKSCSKLFANRADTKLVIAGADDGYLNEARRLAESFNLENKILFTGGLTREDILAAYNDATVVVCAGAQEGFPIVLLEAGIMGKPVIVSDDPAVDFVREAQYGLTVKYGNSDQLAQTLGLILDDPKLLKTLGRNGKKAVTENYSWTVIGKRIEDVYYNILS